MTAKGTVAQDEMFFAYRRFLVHRTRLVERGLMATRIQPEWCKQSPKGFCWLPCTCNTTANGFYGGGNEFRFSPCPWCEGAAKVQLTTEEPPATELAVRAPGAPPQAATASGFGPSIEGFAVDRAGYVYAVNYGGDGAGCSDSSPSAGSPADCSLGTVGRVHPTTKESELFYGEATGGAGADGSKFNAMAVDARGRLFLGDYGNHRVLVFDDVDAADGSVASGQTPRLFCQHERMLQPNDLALAADGSLFLSGMDWGKDVGDVWHCAADGTATELVPRESMGRTNGVALSPDGASLYVSEAFRLSNQNHIWRYPVLAATAAAAGAPRLGARVLFHNFTAAGTGASDTDGMRCDAMGNLWVTRNGLQRVVQLAGSDAAAGDVRAGDVLQAVALTFTAPTNLAFSGADGQTLLVVGRCGINTPWGTGAGCIDSIDPAVVAAPGRMWQLMNHGKEAHCACDCPVYPQCGAASAGRRALGALAAAGGGETPCLGTQADGVTPCLRPGGAAEPPPADGPHKLSGAAVGAIIAASMAFGAALALAATRMRPGGGGNGGDGGDGDWIRQDGRDGASTTEAFSMLSAAPSPPGSQASPRAGGHGRGASSGSRWGSRGGARGGGASTSR